MEDKIQDEQLRKDYAANVEGSKEFNEVAAMDAQDAINELEQDVNQKATEQAIVNMLGNPNVRQNALINAQDIKKKCKGWFTVDQLARKLMLQVEPLQDLLNLICLFQFAYRKEHNGKLRYKIQFSKADKLAILQEQLAEARQTVIKIEKQIEQISNN